MNCHCCYWFLLILVFNAFWKWHYQQQHRIFKIIFRVRCISGRNLTCSLTVVWNIDLPLDSIVSASMFYILFICMGSDIVWYGILYLNIIVITFRYLLKVIKYTREEYWSDQIYELLIFTVCGLHCAIRTSWFAACRC